MECDFSRREFLRIAAGVALAGATGCAKQQTNPAPPPPPGMPAAGPPTGALMATSSPDGSFRVPGGGRLAAGQSLTFYFPGADPAPGIVLKTTKGELEALSARCTHAGCTVAYAASQLHCPCHNSMFATDGQVIKGPATRPLARYAAHQDGDDAVFTRSA